MGSMGGLMLRAPRVVGGAAPVGAAVPAPLPQAPLAVPPNPLLRPRFLHLTLNLSLTRISAVLCFGDSTTWLLAPFHWPFLVLQILSYILLPSARYCLSRMALTPTLWRPRVVIMLSTGWSQPHSGFGRLFLRLSVDFL
ncbi:hypothetical protein [Bat hepatitis E virus]|uniref:Uncharacterized protein n=1 Tax=Bat hepatitis E virus TaxID=1216472 RepID=A0A8A5D676_9VIRU|nr:hypothetical protein [Bat hepatitis E virus]